MLVRCVVFFHFCLAGVAVGGTDTQTTRIVSLVPGLTETLFAIDAGGQVVGVSDFCEYPAEAKSRLRVGGLGNPRLEQLLLLRPTVVLLYRSQADFAEKLNELNVPSRLYNVDRLADVYSATRELGNITGHKVQAEDLISSMSRQFDAIRARNTESTDVRALVLVSRDPTDLRNLYQAGPQNFLGEILQIAGGEHAITGTAAITKEQLVLADPAVIIDLSGGESAAVPGAREMAQALWGQLSTIDAVRNGRMHYLADAHALVPGPYLTKVAEQFETLLRQGEGQ